MEIRTEEEAQAAIESWKKLSPAAQKIRVRGAIEKLELNQMYYEQKGSDSSALRAGRCLAILAGYSAEIS